MDIIDVLKDIEAKRITPEKGAMLIKRCARYCRKNHFVKVSINADDTHINYLPPIPICIITGLVTLALGIALRFIPKENEAACQLEQLNTKEIKSIIQELRYCRYPDVVNIETDNGQTHILIRAF